MQRLLLIERSATLRHALAKILRNSPFAVTSLDSFESGLDLIQSQSKHSVNFQGIILGWPSQTDRLADELFSVLNEPSHQHCALLVMAHEADAALRTWVVRRPHTAMILWDNYADTPVTLEKLLIPNQDTHVPYREALLEDVSSIRILFVDDSPSMRVYYRRLLEKHGYLTETASNVAEATKKAQETPYDIAIIDYFMPDANGDVLCRNLKENTRTSNITAAILTSTYLDRVIKDSLDSGAVECMFKNEADALFLARIKAMSRTIRINKSIEAERQRLQSILNSVGDGVYGVDCDGIITFINPAAKRILGYSREEYLIGKSPHMLFHSVLESGTPNPKEMCLLQNAYGNGRELRAWETVFWHQSGKPIHVECTVYPMMIQSQREGSVVAFRDVSERKSLEEKLRWQATHDPLTELLNRRYFEAELDSEVHRLKRSEENSALLYIDLDRFKYINDTAGHSAGDKLLIKIGRQLRMRLRDTDLLARLGGDEFAVILRNLTQEGVLHVADQFRTALSECSFHYRGKSYKINGSVGVALINQYTKSPGEVLANADIACHIAKTKGRNKTHLYRSGSDDKNAMDFELGWSTRLREALQNDHFVLNYQPIVPIDQINLTHMNGQSDSLWTHLTEQPQPVEYYYEVLVRMRGNDGELIAPNAFIPTAERFNLMLEIDQWVLRHAIEKLAFLNTYWKKVKFAINLSGHSLEDAALLQTAKELLAHHHVDPACVTFEITETTAIANLEAARRFIHELRSIGCRFALDDFGTGFSSFSHLKNLPVDFIKIDGMFVEGMARDPIDLAMVASMNDIAHSLGRKTVAEYAEDIKILKLLQQCGVDYAQGFFVSRPLADIGSEILLPVHKSVSSK